jgi:hypothetical protein
MELHLLYPSNPLRRNKPDEVYGEEYAAALEAGFTVSLFSFEEFLAGDFRARPSLGPEPTVLYRGWMLTPQNYTRLQSAIAGHGAKLLTTPEQYERCHYLPAWYAQLKEFTPMTHFFRESEDVAAQLRALSWTGCFLKDYVKSLSVENGSLIRDLGTIPAVIEKMRSYRGEIEVVFARAKSRISTRQRRRGISFFRGGLFPEPDSYLEWLKPPRSGSTAPFLQWIR